MQSPLISIVITVLNGERTMMKCLKSIEGQLFSNFQLVIVDGGSQDNTVKIIGESSISNMIVHVEPNIGLYAGLNKGVKMSSGKWLYFMGCDDVLYDANTLEIVAEKLKSKDQETKVVVGNVECVKQGYTLYPMLGSPNLMRHQVHHQGMFYRKEIFDDSLYNESMRIASDYEFNLKLAIDGVTHETINLTICDFGGDGISENQLKNGFAEMQDVHRRLFKGADRNWVMSYFWLRRRTGAFLRKYNLFKFRIFIKNIFG